MNFVLHVDSHKVVEFTNKLEQMRKYDLPLAIRGTLNKAAFNVKQVTMPVSADKHFESRHPNFFKANSKVDMAKGFNVNSMESTVGFISSNLQYNNLAVRELQQQEYGGMIPKRSFIPLDQSRRGARNSGPVMPSNRLRAVRNIVDVKNSQGRSGKEKFIRASLAAGRGGFVKAGMGGKEILYRITKITNDKNMTKISKTPIYSYDNGRSVDIDASGFMREATMNSARNLEMFYIEEATKRISKLAATK